MLGNNNISFHERVKSYKIEGAENQVKLSISKGGKKMIKKRKKNLKKVRIVFVSAVCEKEHSLMNRFLEEFNLLASKQQEKDFKLTFYGKASDPAKLLRKADILVTDAVITWGGRKTFLSQVSAVNEQRGSGKSKTIIILPRDKKCRVEFFQKPCSFAKMLMPKLYYSPEIKLSMPETKTTESKEIVNFSRKEKAAVDVKVEKEIFEPPKDYPAKRVMIALSDSFETIEANRLKEMFKTQFAFEVVAIPWKNFRVTMAKEADILITSAVEMRGKLPVLARKDDFNRRNSRVNRVVDVKVHNYQNLAHVDRAKKINPALQVVLLGREVTEFVVRYRKVLAGFLEFPPTEASLAATLQRVVPKTRESAYLN